MGNFRHHCPVMQGDTWASRPLGTPPNHQGSGYPACVAFPWKTPACFSAPLGLSEIPCMWAFRVLECILSFCWLIDRGSNAVYLPLSGIRYTFSHHQKHSFKAARCWSWLLPAQECPRCTSRPVQWLLTGISKLDRRKCINIFVELENWKMWKLGFFFLVPESLVTSTRLVPSMYFSTLARDYLFCKLLPICAWYVISTQWMFIKEWINKWDLFFRSTRCSMLIFETQIGH